MKLIMEELLKELEEAKAKIVEIEKKIKKEQEKEKSRRWKSQEGDIYWFISNNGLVNKGQWDNHSIDRERYLIGNYYRTKEECEFTIEKLKVIAELKEFAEPKDRVWNNVLWHYYIDWIYAHDENEIYVGASIAFKRNDIYFASRKDAEKAIAEVGEERVKKYYLQVED